MRLLRNVSIRFMKAKEILDRLHKDGWIEKKQKVVIFS